MPQTAKSPSPRRLGGGLSKENSLAADAVEVDQNLPPRQAKITRNPVAVDAAAVAAKNRRHRGCGSLMSAYDGQRCAGCIPRAPTGFFASIVGCKPLGVSQTRSEALRAVLTASRDVEAGR
jgi:hypothetical protein